MKKIMTSLVIIGLAVGTARAQKTGWYAGIKGGINMTNHGFATDEGDLDVKVQFGQALNFELNIGQWIKKNWRLQIDLGMIADYQEDLGSDENGDMIRFNEQTKYGMVDGIWTFESGFYIGGGAGIAIVDTKLNIAGIGDVQFVSPMGQIILGQELKLDDNWSLDIGGKMALLYGAKQDYDVLKIGTGLTYNISVLAGVKYYF